MNTKKINASKVLFIKLGKEGIFEEDCLMGENNKMIIDYKEIDHELCLNGLWNDVEDQIKELKKVSPGWGNVKDQLRQLKLFYESGNDVLWITFYGSRLWWGFANSIVYTIKDGKKCRDINWSDCNVKGDKLFDVGINGQLLKTRGYRGTICGVEIKDYVLKKINAEDSPEVQEIKNSRENIKKSIVKLINNLYWDDFEVLIDLIFYQMGWRRTGLIGKTQKDIDLGLINPLTNETAIVQIKSKSNQTEFQEYYKRFKNIEVDKKYFVINNSSNFQNKPKETDVIVYFEDDIAEMVIKSGLIDWVVRRTV